MLSLSALRNPESPAKEFNRRMVWLMLAGLWTYLGDCLGLYLCDKTQTKGQQQHTLESTGLEAIRGLALCSFISLALDYD